MTSFYTSEELQEIGFKSIGENVYISRKSSIYGASNISIGNNVRIDDFCILSGKIDIGNYIHIAAYSAIYGGTKGVELNDFCNISSRVSIYALSDDYSGESMTNPMVPDYLKNVYEATVVIKKHVIIGSTSVILPGVVLEEGCSFGSMSLVNKSTLPWGIYIGVPCKRIKERKKKILELEQEFVNNQKGKRYARNR